MPITAHSDNVPAIQTHPAALIDNTVENPTPTVSAKVTTDAIAFPTNSNKNLARLDALARAGGYGIVTGLTLSAGGGFMLNVAAGQGLVDGIITLASATAKTLVQNVTAYVWLQRDGIVTVRNNDLSAPATPAVFLGAATTNSSGITALDFSGVVYRLPTLFRQTGDLQAPQDTPPTELLALTRTQTGLYLYDTTRWVMVDVLLVAGFTNGLPASGGVMTRFVTPRAFVLLPNLPLSQGYADEVATAPAEFFIAKNGVAIGSFTFGIGSHTPVFALYGGAHFAVGDRLTVVAPSPQDATLADISWSLMGVYQ